MENKIAEISGAKFYGMGRRYWDASLAKLDFDKEINEAILAWVKHGRGILMLEGSVGIGKTYVCAALLNIWHSQHKHCRFFECKDFLAALRSVVNMNGEYLREVDRLCEAFYSG